MFLAMASPGLQKSSLSCTACPADAKPKLLEKSHV